MNILSNIILSLVVVFIASRFWCKKRGNAILRILNRWLIWILFSLVLAYFIRKWNILNHSFFILIPTFFLLWFLVESFWMWREVKFYNLQHLTIFPRYIQNNVEITLPDLPRFDKISEFLNANGFKEVQSIRTLTPIFIGMNIIVFKDESGKNFLKIFLLIHAELMASAMFFSFMSVTDKGDRYITDNLFMPLIGYLPKGWSNVRNPLCTSIDSLFKLHLKKLKKSKKVFVPWNVLPLDELNFQQQLLEEYNLEKGYTNPPEFFNEYGLFSTDGCYNIWKQNWCLKYFGRILS